MLREEFGLFRYENNPIIKPQDFPGARMVFNCGQTMYKNQTVLLVAVILRNNPVPRMHVARSDDGINFKIDETPLITQSSSEHFMPYDGWPIDPRITYMTDEEIYYIIRPGNSDSGCVAILGKTKDFTTYEDIEIISLPDNRVPCLFPEKINGDYVRLDRPYVLLNDPHNYNQHGYIWISYSKDLIHWGRHRVLLKPWSHWNYTKIGPTPPIKTNEGWLVIVHGVSSSCSGSCYSLGAVLLDLKDPSKIIGKTEGYILTPDREYEFNGVVPNVVFSCGAIADTQKDLLRVYYGCADTAIGLATGKLSEIIQYCKEG